jgi:hypothetical protein
VAIACTEWRRDEIKGCTKLQSHRGCPCRMIGTEKERATQKRSRGHGEHWHLDGKADLAPLIVLEKTTAHPRRCRGHAAIGGANRHPPQRSTYASAAACPTLRYTSMGLRYKRDTPRVRAQTPAALSLNLPLYPKKTRGDHG